MLSPVSGSIRLANKQSDRTTSVVGSDGLFGRSKDRFRDTSCKQTLHGKNICSFKILRFVSKKKTDCADYFPLRFRLTGPLLFPVLKRER